MKTKMIIINHKVDENKMLKRLEKYTLQIDHL